MNTFTYREKDGSTSNFIHFPQFFSKNTSDMYLNLCDSITDWKHGTYKTHKLHRVQRYYNTNGEPFSKYWKNVPERWLPVEYEPWLLDLQNHIESCVNEFNIPANFVGALMNKYSSGSDCITKHKDSSEFPDPTVVSISFGAPREFRIHRTVKDLYSLKDAEGEDYLTRSWTLNSGDLFIMSGSSQRYFTHEIVREPNVTSVRYNISFRTN